MSDPDFSQQNTGIIEQIEISTLITLPPRGLKSYCTSVAFPAYALGLDPTTQIICATRMHAQSAKIEAGRVFIPEHAPWLEDFKSEVLAFPNSRHDDQVDSLSQFLGWISREDAHQPVHAAPRVVPLRYHDPHRVTRFRPTAPRRFPY